jgi:hypothetical protein
VTPEKPAFEESLKSSKLMEYNLHNLQELKQEFQKEKMV